MVQYPRRFRVIDGTGAATDKAVELLRRVHEKEAHGARCPAIVHPDWGKTDRRCRCWKAEAERVLAEIEGAPLPFKVEEAAD